jgi:excisionase family DNA binding protein
MVDGKFQEAYSIDDARRQAGGVSRSFIYQLIREKKIRARKLGSRTIILREDLLAYLRTLPEISQ